MDFEFQFHRRFLIDSGCSILHLSCKWPVLFCIGHGFLHLSQKAVGRGKQVSQQGFVHVHVAFVSRLIAALMAQREQADLRLAHIEGMQQALKYQVALVRALALLA